MKMAKPSERDIEAASDLIRLLDALDVRFGGPQRDPEFGENLPELLDEDAFDYDSPTHLGTLYNHLARLIRESPGFHMRVIAGMCYCIMFDKNEIVDPDDDCLSLHPRIEAALAAFDKWSIDIRATSWVIHRNDKSIEHTTDAKTADEARKLGFVVENQFPNPKIQADQADAADYKARQRSMIIGEAVCYYEGKWPKQLGGGTMFFNGERITIEQFTERARLAFPEIYRGT